MNQEHSDCAYLEIQTHYLIVDLHKFLKAIFGHYQEFFKDVRCLEFGFHKESPGGLTIVTNESKNNEHLCY